MVLVFWCVWVFCLCVYLCTTHTEEEKAHTHTHTHLSYMPGWSRNWGPPASFPECWECTAHTLCFSVVIYKWHSSAEILSVLFYLRGNSVPCATKGNEKTLLSISLNSEFSSSLYCVTWEGGIHGHLVQSTLGTEPIRAVAAVSNSASVLFSS